MTAGAAIAGFGEVFRCGPAVVSSRRGIGEGSSGQGVGVVESCSGLWGSARSLSVSSKAVQEDDHEDLGAPSFWD